MLSLSSLFASRTHTSSRKSLPPFPTITAQPSPAMIAPFPSPSWALHDCHHRRARGGWRMYFIQCLSPLDSKVLHPAVATPLLPLPRFVWRPSTLLHTLHAAAHAFKTCCEEGHAGAKALRGKHTAEQVGAQWLKVDCWFVFVYPVSRRHPRTGICVASLPARLLCSFCTFFAHFLACTHGRKKA